MRESTRLPFALISKHPLRGLSALTTTATPGTCAFTSASILLARVLNAFQDLQASIETVKPDAPAAGAFFGVGDFFGATLFFLIADFGAMLQCGSLREFLEKPESPAAISALHHVKKPELEARKMIIKWSRMAARGTRVRPPADLGSSEPHQTNFMGGKSRKICSVAPPCPHAHATRPGSVHTKFGGPARPLHFFECV